MFSEAVLLQTLSVLRVWGEYEAGFLRQLFSQMRLKAKKSSVKTARIPQHIRVETIQAHLRNVRCRIAAERARWLLDVGRWQEEAKVNSKNISKVISDIILIFSMSCLCAKL